MGGLEPLPQGLESKKIQTCITQRRTGSNQLPLPLSNSNRSLKMAICCPSCGSVRIVARNHARKLGGVAGAVAGTASGAAGAMSGAQTGAALGAIAGPIGITLGGLAGAILGGLAGGTAGGLAGARMGEEIDARVLDNFECQRCGLAFSQTEY
jgi:hypothetical protein